MAEARPAVQTGPPEVKEAPGSQSSAFLGRWNCFSDAYRCTASPWTASERGPRRSGDVLLRQRVLRYVQGGAAVQSWVEYRGPSAKVLRRPHVTAPIRVLFPTSRWQRDFVFGAVLSGRAAGTTSLSKRKQLGAAG